MQWNSKVEARLAMRTRIHVKRSVKNASCAACVKTVVAEDRAWQEHGWPPCGNGNGALRCVALYLGWAFGEGDCSYLSMETKGRAPRDAGAEDAGARLGQNCCIGCFRLISSPLEVPPEGGDERQELELLCPSCIHHCKSSKSPAVQSVGGGCGLLLPLPKLSLLVKAEAKCQDQLQILRSQQEILRQQRESLQETKRAKEEALAAERELARQRRKHFLMIQERRKREEEIKFQQFQVEGHTSRSELEASTDIPKKKKSKPPKVDTAFQQPSELTADAKLTDATLPHVVEPTTEHVEMSLSHGSNNHDSGSAAEAHSASLWERRRQMMACYSQDLSPLIDGRKPRRLPFPKHAAANTTVKRRQTPDNNAQSMTVMVNHRTKSHQNARRQSKNPALKATKLRPLEEQRRYIKTTTQQNASNQYEDRGGSTRVVPSPLSLQPPRRLTEHVSPLTAEIKPVSWAYELAKDVLPQNDAHGWSVDETGASTPLHPVAEDLDEPQFTMFPLQYQLPQPTFPTFKVDPPVETTAQVPARWEYSAERLSSLLEKYNVSVSASAPKL